MASAFPTKKWPPAAPLWSRRVTSGLCQHAPSRACLFVFGSHFQAGSGLHAQVVKQSDAVPFLPLKVFALCQSLQAPAQGLQLNAIEEVKNNPGDGREQQQIAVKARLRVNANAMARKRAQQVTRSVCPNPLE